MFPEKTNYPRSLDEFAKQNNLYFPPAKRNVYSAKLEQFVKCVKAENAKKPMPCGDLSHYFDVLTHLKPKEQRPLQYWTIGDHLGSEPIIDVSNIVIDKSPEGAWEAVLLFTLGNQFHLGWHAGYSQICIVTSWRKFYLSRPADEVSGKRVCAEADMKTLSTWDVTPKVEMNDDETATVYYCVCSAWHGFKQISQRVHFDTGKLDDPVTLEHVPYDCGILF